MALIKCKECSKQISSKAKSCPHCGALTPKKTSVLTWILFVFIGLPFGYTVFVATSVKNEQAKQQPTASTGLENVELDFNWNKSGFGSVMMAKLIIKNKNDFEVKDLVVKCDLFGNSGSRIGTATKTVYESVPAKTAKTINDVNMGFINSQTSSTSCGIVGFKK